MNKTSLEELLSLSVAEGLSGVYVAIPCEITAIPENLEDLRVDVKPVIDVLYADGTSEEHSQILGVPVVFPAGRVSMLSFPLFVGDTVLCVFSQQSLDNFKVGNGTSSAPNDMRRMDSRDAIAIPGLVPFAKSLNRPANRVWPHTTADYVIAHNIMSGTEVELRMKRNGDIIINTAQNAFVNCANATITAQQDISLSAGNNISLSAATMSVNIGSTSWTGSIVQTGDYTQTGTYTLDGININLHKHTGVTPGPGVSGGSTN